MTEHEFNIKEFTVIYTEHVPDGYIVDVMQRLTEFGDPRTLMCTPYYESRCDGIRGIVISCVIDKRAKHLFNKDCIQEFGQWATEVSE